MANSRIRTLSGWILLGLIAGGPLPIRGETLPDAVALLKSALEGPSISYHGHMMVTRWFGKRAHAEEVELYFGSPNRYRREFLTPDGRVDRIVVGDGKTETIYIPKQNRELKGDAIKSSSKLIGEDKETQLLFKNYKISIQGSDRIVGRPTWVLELAPIVAGKHFQRLWVDKETYVVLENKSFTPGSRFAVISRFSQFDIVSRLPDSLFQVDIPSGTRVDEHGIDSAFMSMEELNSVTGKNLKLPEELPGGFVFENANVFEVGKYMVRQLGYTDGLSMLSIFVTEHPVRLPEGSDISMPIAVPGSLRLSSTGKVLHWKTGRLHFTLIGDPSKEILEQISSYLSQAANFSAPHPY